MLVTSNFCLVLCASSYKKTTLFITSDLPIRWHVARGVIHPPNVTKGLILTQNGFTKVFERGVAGAFLKIFVGTGEVQTLEILGVMGLPPQKVISFNPCSAL